MADGSVTPGLDVSKIGASFESAEFVVDAARTVAYAEAIGDTNPAHLSGRAAPPVFAVVPAMQPMATAFRAVVPGGFAVHGEHDLRIDQQIRPGMRLVATASAVGLWPKSAGLVVVIRITTRTVQGEPVNEQHWVNVVLKASAPQGTGEMPPMHRVPAGLSAQEPCAQAWYDLPSGIGRRYADASGDHSPYTFDDEAARALGLPGAIMGGICTMSYASRALVEHCCSGHAERLRRIALRFSRLVVLRPGQRLGVAIWRIGGDGHKLAFNMQDAAGDTVVTNGFAEIVA